MKATRRICAALAAAAFLAGAAGSEEIQVISSGKYHDPVTGYKVGAYYYLNAKDVGSVYGGQVYWYPVAGRVQMSFRGKPLQFLANSDVAAAQDRKFKLDQKILLRAGQAFVPLSLFLSEAFSAWVGMDTAFNAHTRLLTVDKRSSVGSVRWFSYKDCTRLVIELGPTMAYETAARGLAGLEVTIPYGVIESAEQAKISDGVVDSYSLRQDARAARLSVRLAVKGGSWRVREFSGPRRLAVDIYKPGAQAQPPAVAAKPAARTESAGSAAAKPAEPASEAVVAHLPPMPPVVTPSGRAKRRIVIDAGHGGKDAGAIGRRGTQEKDINLLAARQLAALLREEDVFEVLLTRTDDSFVPLSDRSRLANEFNADLFISLHCNASLSRRDSGFEVYFLSEKASDPEAERLAEFENSVLSLEGKTAQDDDAATILVAMTKTEHINSAAELSGFLARSLARRVDMENRGVKQAAFYVLRGTNAPAVLFEMAYVSNQKDETKLESAKYRRKIVDALYAGVLEFSKARGWLADTALYAR